MYRIGFAKDIHPLKEGRKLILCGVEIPHSHGLDGHSDADAALHAIGESILGALALGDLGTYFPPSNNEFKDKESSYFVIKIVKMMKEKGYQINNVDVSILAEAPRLAPYILLMREKVALLLETHIDNVSIKAGTNEKMDAVGRKEAIEATSIVMLKRI